MGNSIYFTCRDCGATRFDLGGVEHSAEELQNERIERENEIAHLRDDYEQLRGRILGRLREEISLLNEGLHALRRVVAGISAAYGIGRAVRRRGAGRGGGAVARRAARSVARSAAFRGGRRPPVRLIDVAQDLGDRDEGFDGNLLAHLGRGEEFDQIRILLDRHARLARGFQDALGQMTAAGRAHHRGAVGGLRRIGEGDGLAVGIARRSLALRSRRGRPGGTLNSPPCRRFPRDAGPRRVGG